MKQLLIFIAMLPLAGISAQDTTGVITYEQIISTNLDKDNIPEGLRNIVPSESKSEMELYFTPTASLYQIKENTAASNNQEFDQGGMKLRIETKVPDDKYYTDLTSHKVTEQKDFMGRIFLIDHDANTSKWKFTGRQKKILDMPSSEAISITDKDTIIVWFTTSIPVSAGPQGHSGLPGMVLEVFVGSNIHLVATKVEPADKGIIKKIKAPAKGKKIDEVAFEKIVKEKEEEMKKQYGGNGNIIIMRQTR
jgi:GLPGLI family protein